MDGRLCAQPKDRAAAAGQKKANPPFWQQGLFERLFFLKRVTVDTSALPIGP
jgi:hypothetical protein